MLSVWTPLVAYVIVFELLLAPPPYTLDDPVFEGSGAGDSGDVYLAAPVSMSEGDIWVCVYSHIVSHWLAETVYWQCVSQEPFVAWVVLHRHSNHTVCSYNNRVSITAYLPDWNNECATIMSRRPGGGSDTGCVVERDDVVLVESTQQHITPIFFQFCLTPWQILSSIEMNPFEQKPLVTVLFLQ